jgi:hypothetical protein
MDIVIIKVISDDVSSVHLLLEIDENDVKKVRNTLISTSLQGQLKVSQGKIFENVDKKVRNTLISRSFEGQLKVSQGQSKITADRSRRRTRWVPFYIGIGEYFPCPRNLINILEYSTLTDLQLTLQRP